MHTEIIKFRGGPLSPKVYDPDPPPEVYLSVTEAPWTALVRQCEAAMDPGAWIRGSRHAQEAPDVKDECKKALADVLMRHGITEVLLEPEEVEKMFPPDADPRGRY